MKIADEGARVLLARSHDDLLDLERRTAGPADGTPYGTRAQLINFRIGLSLRVILDGVDDPEVLRAAAALDGRWRALQPKLTLNRGAPGAFLVP